jgi:3',5'-cyclic AMP phosphodiesterase CpdA
VSVSETIVAQLSDTHVVAPGSRYFWIDSARHLRHALAFVEAMRPRPNAIVLSGDLVNFGRAVEYAHLREILAGVATPWYVIPGNHDNRARFRAAFADRPEVGGEGSVRFAIDTHAVRLIGLDSVVPKNYGGIGGGLDDESLAWLETQLGGDDARPVLVFLHHPPFATGIRYIDFASFVNGERLWNVLARRRVPVRVVSGHVHSVHAHERDGVLAMSSRSTAPQIVPEVLERRPFWLRRQQPGFTLHRYDERGFESIDYVGDGAGAFAPARVVDANGAT